MAFFNTVKLINEFSFQFLYNIFMRIFWAIQQLEKLGGTEIVTIDLINRLVNYYPITLICIAGLNPENNYKIDPRVKITYLNADSETIRNEEKVYNYNKQGKYLKSLRVYWKVVEEFFFKQNYYRKKIANIMGEKTDSLYIGSCAEAFLLAPKNYKVYFHYHFDDKTYNLGWMKLNMKRSRKADKYIFLSKSILKEVVKTHPKLKEKSTYVYNPIRFEPVLDTKKYDNTIIFAGRYVEQKNPLLALKIAKLLKEKGLNFYLKMFGEGLLLDKMLNYQNENNLNDVVSINKPRKDIENEIKTSDLLLLTSTYEGYVLVKGEANAFSKPVIMSNWGNTSHEMIDDGVDGFVIDSFNPEDYANKIYEILTNDNYLAKLKETTYEKTKNLNENYIIQEWLKIIG